MAPLNNVTPVTTPTRRYQTPTTPITNGEQNNGSTPASALNNSGTPQSIRTENEFNTVTPYSIQQSGNNRPNLSPIYEDGTASRISELTDATSINTPRQTIIQKGIIQPVSPTTICGLNDTPESNESTPSRELFPTTPNRNGASRSLINGNDDISRLTSSIITTPNQFYQDEKGIYHRVPSPQSITEPFNSPFSDPSRSLFSVTPDLTYNVPTKGFRISVVPNPFPSVDNTNQDNTNQHTDFSSIHGSEQNDLSTTLNSVSQRLFNDSSMDESDDSDINSHSPNNSTIDGSEENEMDISDVSSEQPFFSPE